MASKLLARQAVVVGAGMAGLAAARVLADYFEHVTVLERDTLPTETSHRSGIPQSKHVHALLGGGQRALSDLFPGVEDDLARAGAVPFRVGLDVRLETPRHDPFPRRDLGWIAYSMSRPLIEHVVRRRVEQQPWALAAIPDFVFSQTRGERPPDFERTREFGAALTLLAARDAHVHKLMIEVQQLLMPRSALRNPDLVERVRAVMAET